MGSKSSIKYIKVHVAVMLAFVGICPNDMEIRHIDGNTRNSKLSNLEYVTHQVNMDDKLIHGTHNRGENHSYKLSWADVVEIRHMYKQGYVSQTEIAKKYSVDPSHISRIVNKSRNAWLEEGGVS